MRAPLLALAAALAVLPLSACTPERVGGVAVGVDADGGPVLVMASCNGPAGTIEVSSAADRADATAATWRIDLRLENPDPRFSDPAAVALNDPDRRWAVTDGAADFTDGRRYRASAWPANDDRDAETLGWIEFTTAQLTEVGPGEVLVEDGNGHRVVPVADFLADEFGRCEEYLD